MEKLNGRIKAEDVDEAFKREKESRTQSMKNAMDEEYQCTQCLLSGRKDFMKPPRCFGVVTPAMLLPLVIADGAWTRCLPCREAADNLRISNGMVEVYTNSHDDFTDGPSATSAEQIFCSCCAKWGPLEFYTQSRIHHRARATSLFATSAKMSGDVVHA